MREHSHTKCEIYQRVLWNLCKYKHNSNHACMQNTADILLMSEFYHGMIWQTTCATARMSKWFGIHVQCCAPQGDDSARPVGRESVSPCSVIPNRAVSPVLLSIWVSLSLVKFCDILFLSSCTLLSFLFFDALFLVCLAHQNIFGVHSTSSTSTSLSFDKNFLIFALSARGMYCCIYG